MKLLEMFNDNYTEMHRFWFLPPNQSIKFNQGHTEFAYEHSEIFGINLKEFNMDDLLDAGICDNPSIFHVMFKKGWVRILYDTTLNELAIDNPKIKTCRIAANYYLNIYPNTKELIMNGLYTGGKIFKDEQIKMFIKYGR